MVFFYTLPKNVTQYRANIYRAKRLIKWSIIALEACSACQGKQKINTYVLLIVGVNWVSLCIMIHGVLSWATVLLCWRTCVSSASQQPAKPGGVPVIHFQVLWLWATLSPAQLYPTLLSSALLCYAQPCSALLCHKIKHLHCVHNNVLTRFPECS